MIEAIKRYFTLSSGGLTRQQYFDMVESIGAEPVESQIPIEITDFGPDIQKLFRIYSYLNDVWADMAGVYLGKDFSALEALFNIFEVEDRQLSVHILALMSSIQKEEFNKKQKQKQSLNENKSNSSKPTRGRRRR